MAGDVRQRMAAGAAQLLAQNGFQGTSFADVLELTGAPRGSIYHHFPGGKDELVLAALDLASERAIAVLDEAAGESAVDIAERFLAMWRRLVVHTDFTTGCSVLGVTVSADSPEVIDRAAAIFRDWRGALATRLARAGLDEATASATAVLLIASAEGAVVLCRAEKSVEPLDTVAAQLRAYILAASQC